MGNFVMAKTINVRKQQQHITFYVLGESDSLLKTKPVDSASNFKITVSYLRKLKPNYFYIYLVLNFFRYAIYYKQRDHINTYNTTYVDGDPNS